MGKKTVEERIKTIGKQIGYLKQEAKALRKEISKIKKVLKDAHILSLDA